ncbi:MAG: hypothetical protein Ct9H300mP3_09860 [Gammaproteobacteria bacterium]|nr:MAG: hypothetical protein Ct9H300mP3_09860 [Gammaproteobacteria bacterium]
MFGSVFPEESMKIRYGLFRDRKGGKTNQSGLPNYKIYNFLEQNISGLDIQLYHAPGETNDQIFVWIPKYKALFPGDNFYKAFPNLYTIRGTHTETLRLGKKYRL